MAPGVPGPASYLAFLGTLAAFVGLNHRLSAPCKEPVCPACLPAGAEPPPQSPVEEGYSAPFLVFVASLTFLAGVGFLALFGALAAAVGAASLGFAGGAVGGAVTGAVAARAAAKEPPAIEGESDISGLVEDYVRHESPARGSCAPEVSDW